MEIDIKKIRQMITDCKRRKSKLSSWEHDFILSILSQEYLLTVRQIQVLEKIWDEHGSIGVCTHAKDATAS